MTRNHRQVRSACEIAKINTQHANTLDQAAALIEFEDDPDATERLIQYAEEAPHQFPHELQRQRDERTRADGVAHERDTPTGQGFTILESRPDSYYDKAYVDIRDLVDTDNTPVTLHHLTTLSLAYYVTDPKAHGFREVSSTGTGTGPMSDEQKAERRALIANNKAWVSAQPVRREWITTLLTRKTLPKNAATLIAVGLTQHRTDIARALSAGNDLAATLFGLPPQESYWTPSPLDSYAEQAGKAVVTTLAVGARSHGTGHRHAHMAQPRPRSHTVPWHLGRLGLPALRRRTHRRRYGR